MAGTAQSPPLTTPDFHRPHLFTRNLLLPPGSSLRSKAAHEVAGGRRAVSGEPLSARGAPPRVLLLRLCLRLDHDYKRLGRVRRPESPCARN